LLIFSSSDSFEIEELTVDELTFDEKPDAP